MRVRGTEAHADAVPTSAREGRCSGDAAFCWFDANDHFQHSGRPEREAVVSPWGVCCDGQTGSPWEGPLEIGIRPSRGSGTRTALERTAQVYDVRLDGENLLAVEGKTNQQYPRTRPMGRPGQQELSALQNRVGDNCVCSMIIPAKSVISSQFTFWAPSHFSPNS